MDVYTHDWTSFDEMAKYSHPYVTKLIDLDIIYVHDESVLEHYRKLQLELNKNMSDDNWILKNIQKHFNETFCEFNELNKNEDNLGNAYRSLSHIIKEIEFIIYMINKSYIKRGSKRVPEEICKMNILPENFVENYKDITNCKTIEEIKDKANTLVSCIRKFLKEKGIDYIPDKKYKKEIQKKEILPNNLIGTYEEIYSNWKNKMIHAVSINSRYLSFVTMNSCQEFYDEMSSMFNIPKIELIVNYNPDNLNENVHYFNICMDKWLDLYKEYDVEVNYYANLDDLENLYR